MMAKVKFLFLISIFVVCCKWHVACENDWISHYQRIQTIQIGLIQNKNLNKFMNSSQYDVHDNKAFINDRTKDKRSYNTQQCIRDLRKIQQAFNDNKTNWAFQSEHIFLKTKTPSNSIDFQKFVQNSVLGTWGKLSSVERNTDYGNFDRCHGFETNKSVNIETQYCISDIDARQSNVGKM